MFEKFASSSTLVFIATNPIPVLKQITSIFCIVKNIPFEPSIFPCIAFFSVYSNMLQSYLLRTADLVSSGSSSNFLIFSPLRLKLENKNSLALGKKYYTTAMDRSWRLLWLNYRKVGRT